MKIMIIGCGNFGVKLAQRLNDENHDIVIIDKNKENFHNLGTDFMGVKLEGIGYDKEVLEKAKVSECDTVIACTSSDSANAVIGNIARNVYHIPQVIVRMYDPIKAKIFASMGMIPISISTLGVDTIMEIIQEEQSSKVKDIEHDSTLYKVKSCANLEGKALFEEMEKGKYEIIAIVRNKRTLFIEEIDKIEEGDVLYYIVKKEAKEEWKRKIGGKIR